MTMTPTMRAEINRRNAARSTGPKSPEAKLKTRFNAVKHGCRARLPILPGEDPDTYQRRLGAWIAKFRPADDVELYLVEPPSTSPGSSTAPTAPRWLDWHRKPTTRPRGMPATSRCWGPSCSTSPAARSPTIPPWAAASTRASSPRRSSGAMAVTPLAWSSPWRPPRWAADGCGSNGPRWASSSTTGSTGRRPTGCGRSGCWAVSRWTWSTWNR